ncbi:MAG: ankyrin repeat domain-containing protein [Patescibacteria group bacterium]
MSKKIISSIFALSVLLITLITLNACQNGKLQKIIYSHPWEDKSGEPTEPPTAPNTVFFLPERYFVVSEKGEVLDQGYLEVDESSRTLFMQNGDGSLQFKVNKMSDTELSGEMTATTWMGTSEGWEAVLAEQKNAPELPKPSNLDQAAEWGDIEAIDKFLAEGKTVNDQIPSGWTPLMSACVSLHPAAVTHLLEKGADTELKNNKGNTALTLTAYGNNWKVAKALTEKGADINVKDSDGETPIVIAVRDHSLELVKVLLEAGANANDINEYGEPLLSSGLSDYEGQELVENLDMVKLLIKYGADVNGEDTLGQTPLWVAAGNGLADTVKYLLSKGADTNITVSLDLHDNKDKTLKEWVEENDQMEKIGPILWD